MSASGGNACERDAMNASGGNANPKPILRRMRRVSLVACAVMLPVLCVSAWFATRQPIWWKPIARADQAAAERAAAFEQAIVAAFTKVRQDAPEWAIRIQASDLNEWLATRLPAWIENRDQPTPGAMQLLLQSNQATLAMDRGMVITWLRTAPRAIDGGISFERVGIGLGRLAIPFAKINLSSMLDQAGLRMPITLADGRVVHILDLEVLDGEIRLRLRTQRP